MKKLQNVNTSQTIYLTIIEIKFCEVGEWPTGHPADRAAWPGWWRVPGVTGVCVCIVALHCLCLRQEASLGTVPAHVHNI